MKTVDGNILNITNGIICHQVNCKKVAGAGLALQIRNRFPGWYQYYQSTVPLLGHTSLYQVNKDITIASLYAQDGYGTEMRQTDYVAFRACLQVLRYSPRFIYIPVGIGCGLAGGNWDRVYSIIEENLPSAILVKYNQ